MTRDELLAALTVERFTRHQRTHPDPLTAEPRVFQVAVYDPVACAEHQRELAGAVGGDVWVTLEAS